MDYNSLKGEILEKLLYKWVEEKKIPHIRAGMVEDVEGFILGIMAQLEAFKSANRMSISSGDSNEKDS